MKLLSLYSAALISMAAIAQAGSVEGPEVEAPVASTEPQNIWQGFYGGLSYSGVSGQIDENSFGPAVTPDFDSTNGAGIFAGYNWQRGNFVYGGEVNYVSFDTPFVGFPNSIQSDLLELRARGGYAFDNLLLFGFVGYSTSELNDGGTVFDQSGAVYGIGADYLIKDRYLLGLEFSRRSVSGSAVGGTLGTEIDLITLRFGYHF